jgi:hypothetical protein
MTKEEYQRRIVALHSGLPEASSKLQEEQVRRQELELTIDHRLGCDFPSERREELWAVQQRIDRKRGRLLFQHLLRRLLPGGLERSAKGLASLVVDEYSKQLSREELEAFLGESEVQNPSLPVARARRPSR